MSNLGYDRGEAEGDQAKRRAEKHQKLCRGYTVDHFVQRPSRKQTTAHMHVCYADHEKHTTMIRCHRISLEQIKIAGISSFYPKLRYLDLEDLSDKAFLKKINPERSSDDLT